MELDLPDEWLGNPLNAHLEFEGRCSDPEKRVHVTVDENGRQNAEYVLTGRHKIYLNYKVHNYTMGSMRCEYCKKNIHSLNQILDMFVCDECYHRLISKIYYPNAMEA